LQLDINKQNRTRIMGQMIIWALEQSLGRFILEHWFRLTSDNSTLAVILERKPLLAKNQFSQDQVRKAVEESYLKELFVLAIACCDQTSESETLKELNDFSTAIELSDIRNAACHSNRPFYDHYWFRIAALAADPRIHRLGLIEVPAALQAVLAGQIKAPPESWAKIRSQLPNNLPSHFEHSSTGLIGRDAERKRLWKEFKNLRKRFFAIVSPGGNGKTALALDFLNELCSSAEGQTLVDAVVYVSLKSEALTATGIVNIQSAPDSTPLALRSEIQKGFDQTFTETLGTYEEACNKFHNQKIVLFIDNAEKLLLDSPDALETLESTLPVSWRLLVTSRIVVENAASLPLAPLSKESSKQLVRYYIGSSGGYPEPEDELVDKIVVGAKFNPLAMKLVVDTYVQGHDITESLEKAVSETTEFSFAGLLDVLPNETINVMEALYVDEEVSRHSLASVLNLDLDKISRSLHQLCRTSLAVRTYNNGIERILLNEQVRELLRVNPKNHNTRNLVVRALRARRARLTDIRASVNRQLPTDLRHVPDSAPNDLVLLVQQIYKATKKGSVHTNLPSLYRAVIDGERDFKAISAYWRMRGFLMWHLQDRAAAVDCLNRSLAIDENDLPSLRLLASWMSKEQQSDVALKLYERLRALNACDSKYVEEEFANAVLAGYLNSLTYLGKFEEVANETKDWHKRLDVGRSLASVRIGCFKRWANNEPAGSEEHDKKFLHAVHVFEQAANEFGLGTGLILRGRELIKEIFYIVRANLASQTLIVESAGFLGRYMSDLLDAADTLNAEALELSPRFSDAMKQRANVVRNESIVNTHGGTEQVAEFVARGFQIVTVKPLPPYVDAGRSSYRFAQDENGEEYFLHQGQLAKDVRIPWSKLLVGAIVAVRRVPSTRSSTRWTARDIYPISVVESE